MLARNTLIAAAAAIAITSTPAAAEGFDFAIAAQDFLLQISGHNDHRSTQDYRPQRQRRRHQARHQTRHQTRHHAAQHRSSHQGTYTTTSTRRHNAHTYTPQPRRVYVEGRYETQVVRKWVEGYYENVHVPAVYRTESYYDACGTHRTRSVLVQAAHCASVWRPGCWTTENVSRWVPGHWVDH